MRRIRSDDDPATITEAFKELSKSAFAVWIRLMMVPEKQLVNRIEMAKLLEYSPAQCNSILRELKQKGYLKMIRGSKVGDPTRFVIKRRAIIAGPNQFLSLSNLTLAPIPDDPHRKKLFIEVVKGLNRSEDLEKDLGILESLSQPLNPSKKDNFLSNLPITPESLDNCDTQHPEIPVKENSKDGQIANSAADKPSTTGGRISYNDLPKGRKKMKAGPEFDENLIHGLKSSDEAQKLGGAININKYNKGFKKIKKERSERAKKGVKTRKNRRFALAKERVIDWTKLDQRGDPTISFVLSNAKRRKMIAVLDRSNRDAVKKRLLEKLATEFGRIYSRYRRLLQKEVGNVPSYQMPPQERKYAMKAAEWCIRKEVTPRQVLKYWHLNIANFAEKKMRIPPLAFLSSPANIDTVACALMGSDESHWEAGKNNKTVSTHGFSDLNQLDPRLRRALIAAGFDAGGLNDRYLLTIQKTAQAIVKGARLFVSRENKSMVDWAAKNLYG